MKFGIYKDDYIKLRFAVFGYDWSKNNKDTL